MAMNSPRATSRTLGSVRVNKGSILPPLSKSLSDSHKVYFQDHNFMITGDAVHTTVRGDREDLHTRSSMSRPLTSRVESGSKLVEELKDLQTKERQQRNKITSLHKSVEQLKSDMKDKEEEVGSIQAKFQAMEEHYRKLYEEEKSEHSKTKEQLDKANQQLAEKINLVEELKARHEQKITEITDLYESRLHGLSEEKDKEIAERDERINKLKNQMADILKGNSWERQQQLEELSKELTKVSEETSMLRMKLKSLKSKKDCEKCDRLRGELEQKKVKITEKDGLIKQLKALCTKFETQLDQQDVLLKQFAESNGYKGQHPADYSLRK